MVKRIVLSLLAVLLVGAVVVFGVWKPFSGWSFDDVLAEAQADFGKDRRVVAVEVDHGTVAFVMAAGGGRVQVRHYARHCVLKDGDSTVNGTHVEGNCEVRTRRVRTFTRAATAADRGPTVPLGAFSADVIDRLQDAGMRSLDDPVFWHGRWRFDAPLTVARSAAPDGTDVEPAKGTSGEAAVAVRDLVGAPPFD